MKKKIINFFRALKAYLPALIGFITAELTWTIAFALTGAWAISMGIFLLWGMPFALICGGIFSMLFAWVIFRGIGNG